MFVNSNLCVWIPAVLVNRIETRRPAFRRGFCPVLCPGCCSGLFYVRFGRVRGARNPVVRRCGKSALRVESPCEAIIFRGILIDCVLWGYCEAVTKKDNGLIINCFFCAPGASILEHFLVGFGCDLGYGAVFSTTIMENYFFAIYYGIGNFFLSCNVRIND